MPNRSRMNGEPGETATSTRRAGSFFFLGESLRLAFTRLEPFEKRTVDRALCRVQVGSVPHATYFRIERATTPSERAVAAGRANHEQGRRCTLPVRKSALVFGKSRVASGQRVSRSHRSVVESPPVRRNGSRGFRSHCFDHDRRDAPAGDAHFRPW
jgi:hypothetical protein